MLRMIQSKWAATFVAVALLVGCRREVRPVLYVFPDNFRGVFMFEGLVTTGAVVKAIDGVRTFDVPSSGKLKIQGRLPTRDWHSPVARFQNGQSIPLASGRIHVSKDTIALRPIRSEKETDWFVVGTYSDAAKALEQITGLKWHLD